MSLPASISKDLLRKPGVNIIYKGTKVTKGIDTGIPCTKIGVTKKFNSPDP